jgi:hypothetical protein
MAQSEGPGKRLAAVEPGNNGEKSGVDKAPMMQK